MTRKYAMWGMEIDPEADTDEVVDYIANAIIEADVGKYKPDETTKGVAVVTVIPTDRQKEWNRTVCQMSMEELARTLT